MKKIIGTALLVAMAVSAPISCKKGEPELEQDHIISVMDNFDLPSNTEWMVILPGLGCTGCIQEGEYFVKENASNPKTFIVLTKIESLKILQHKLNIRVDTIPNVYADKESKYVLPTNNSIYPCIVHLKDGAYESHEFQSPENGNAFERLAAQLLINANNATN